MMALQAVQQQFAAVLLTLLGAAALAALPRGAAAINTTTSWGTGSLTYAPDSAYRAWTGIAYSPSLDAYCVVGRPYYTVCGASGAMLGSSGCLSWASVTVADPVSYWASVAWSPTLNLFAAVSGSAGAKTYYLMTSPSCSSGSWTGQAYPPGFGPPYNFVIWAGGSVNLFVAGGAGTTLIVSANGIAVSPRARRVLLSGFSRFLFSLRRGRRRNHPDRQRQRHRGEPFHFKPEFCSEVTVPCLSSRARKPIMMIKRRRGLQWTGRTAPVATSVWYGAAFSASAASPVLVIVGHASGAAAGSAGQALVSSDGATFTVVSTATGLQAVAWSPALGLFAAVSGVGDSVALTSPDGERRSLNP